MIKYFQRLICEFHVLAPQLNDKQITVRLRRVLINHIHIHNPISKTQSNNKTDLRSRRLCLRGIAVLYRAPISNRYYESYIHAKTGALTMLNQVVCLWYVTNKPAVGGGGLVDL
jgi:hypothetical protein